MKEFTTKEKILIKCDETLNKLTEDIQKEHNLTWDESAEIVGHYLSKLISV